MKKKIILMYFWAIPLLVVSGFVFLLTKANAADDLLLAPDIFISSTNLSQADILLVVVKNETNAVNGTLGMVKLRFFRSEDNKDWISYVGIPLHKTPGDYMLTINIAGKVMFQKSITVVKRDFPVTILEITPKLKREGYTAKKITHATESNSKILQKILSVITPKAYFSKPFVYPLSNINVVGPYGDIRQFGNYKLQHLGVDLKASLATPVYAINNGKVVFEGNLPDYGNTIIINHGLGIYSLYLHLSSFKVKNGHMLNQGDVIGLSGDTGYTTAPHLHFSIKMRGASIDPLRFIQKTQVPW